MCCWWSEIACGAGWTELDFGVEWGEIECGVGWAETHSETAEKRSKTP